MKKLYLMMVGVFIIACPKSTYGAALPEDDNPKPGWFYNYPTLIQCLYVDGMTQQHMERMTWLLRGQEGTRREKYREDLLEKALRVKNLDDLFNVLQKRKGWSRLIGREINPYFRNLGSINAASEALLQIKLPTDLDYLIF